ncbi:MAG: hypothetical protein QM831_12955 [Kofleriaceae bacterium]
MAVFLTACTHPDPQPRPIANRPVAIAVDAAVDAETDPCVIYFRAADRALACTAIPQAIRDEIRAKYDDMGPAAVERHLDGADGTMVEIECMKLTTELDDVTTRTGCP